jgi:hypothetical protein
MATSRDWPILSCTGTLQGLLDAGAQMQQEAKDVGGGLLIATVKDAVGPCPVVRDVVTRQGEDLRWSADLSVHCRGRE